MSRWIIVLLASCTTSASTTEVVSSGFDFDDDGWRIVGDAQEATPQYSPTGGNPAGLISADDDVTGGVWYFRAPSKFRGDQSENYGRDISFDLEVTPITH